jgi:hypothetical protein
MKGFSHLLMVLGGALIGLAFGKSFSLLVLCALLSVGWVLYWVIGGFFDMD